MPKIYRPGKVAILLRGRFAGRKVVVIRAHEDGTKDKPFPHAIVAGIDRYPLKVTRSMGPKRIARRSKIKPFIKTVNYTHLLPTRYALDVEGALKSSLTSDTFKSSTSDKKEAAAEGRKNNPSRTKSTELGYEQRLEARKTVKKVFEERYAGGKNKWFFEKLRF